MRLLEMSVVTFVVRWRVMTCLKQVAYWVDSPRIDEVVYAGYRVVMLSGHKHDDDLGNMSS